MAQCGSRRWEALSVINYDSFFFQHPSVKGRGDGPMRPWSSQSSTFFWTQKNCSDDKVISWFIWISWKQGWRRLVVPILRTKSWSKIHEKWEWPYLAIKKMTYYIINALPLNSICFHSISLYAHFLHKNIYFLLVILLYSPEIIYIVSCLWHWEPAFP